MIEKYKRLYILLLFMIAIACAIFFVLKALEEKIVFFYSPTEILNKEINNNELIRVGGLVKKNSIEIENKNLKFVITDFKNEIIVTFSGAVPNLFEEGKGVVAEGYLEDRKYLKAEKILAKHDENYMPPEVKEAMQGN